MTYDTTTSLFWWGPKEYQPSNHYSLITQEYPTHLFHSQFGETYSFGWYDYYPSLIEYWESHDGFIIDFIDDMVQVMDINDDEPEWGPIEIGPVLPPIQGPPEPNQVYWSYPDGLKYDYIAP